MKKINKLLLILTITGMFAACTKALDVEPQQTIDAGTALQNDQDVNSLMVRRVFFTWWRIIIRHQSINVARFNRG